MNTWQIQWEEPHASGPAYTKIKVIEAKHYGVKGIIGIFTDNGDTVKHSVPADKCIVTQIIE